MDDLVRLAAIASLREIFRPSAPTNSLSLFRGRKRELESVLSAFAESGQHAVVYGERGVGKTSLSYVTSEVFASVAPESTLVVRVQCTDGDNFDSVWRSFYRELVAVCLSANRDLRDLLADALEDVETLLLYPDQEVLTPPVVAAAIRRIADKCRLLIVIDEFDRLGGVVGSPGFSDLIKSLSDSVSSVTLMIVGVADDVTGLISGHLSVERNLRQVAMPMMTDLEIMEIVTGGFEEFQRRTSLHVECKLEAAAAIAAIAKGFPYYAHLLAGAAGIEALNKNADSVTSLTVIGSMLRAVEDASHAIRTKYVDATLARADSRIELTVLACALTVQDELGYFSSTEVAKQLSTIMKVERNAGHVNAHLARLSEAPSYVLEQRRFSEKRVRYRFRDPLMRPFVLMKGYESGTIPGAAKPPLNPV